MRRRSVSLTLYNTLSRRKETFAPIDPANVRMYVCGPTVYDYAHIGNARPVIVFDVLFRLLRHVYGENHVTYVRNITDVDDKINARAAKDFPDLPLNEAIRKVTGATEKQFHGDIAALGVLPPTVEPRATEHIEEMKRLIEALVSRGNAYVAEGHALFDVSSMADYGRLSNRSLEEMEAGARVEVAPYKKGAMDFVLWKPSKPGEPSWSSPSGIAEPGRPGWHIECSAMAEKHLGSVFDIHGGGIDLVFPHHENEIAQSRCAHNLPVMANVWMHNGFLQVEGEKMSKSLGNFITINELLATKKFGANQWHGRVVRWAMLGTHYRQPIDWTADRLLQARATLLDLADLLVSVEPADAPNAEVVASLSDDLNTPSALSIIHGLAKSAKRNPETAAELRATLEFMGLYGGETRYELNVGVEAVEVDAGKVDELVAARLAARKAKDFKESDRLRDELAAMGVALKDAKDPATGEIVTTWEIAR
jgi:cysteinyl-tRNA synthetase